MGDQSGLTKSGRSKRATRLCQNAATLQSILAGRPLIFKAFSKHGVILRSDSSQHRLQRNGYSL